MEYDDVLRLVIVHVTGATFKTVTGVCRRWHAHAYDVYPGGFALANHLATLVEKFPGANWRFDRLSYNPLITWDVVRANTGRNWDWEGLSDRGIVPLEFIERVAAGEPTGSRLTREHMHLFANHPGITLEHVDRWNLWYRTRSPLITWDIVNIGLIRPRDFNFRMLSRHPNITWDIIQANQTFANGERIPWDYDVFAHGPNATLEVFSSDLSLWDWGDLSNHPLITMEFTREHRDLEWAYYYVSINPNLTWEFVRENPTVGWDWKEVSRHRCVTWDRVVENPNMPWSHKYLSSNPNITREIVAANPQIQWDPARILANPAIPWDRVLPPIDDVDLWRLLSGRPEITWKFVADRPHLPWNWGTLSSKTVWGGR